MHTCAVAVFLKGRVWGLPKMAFVSDLVQDTRNLSINDSEEFLDVGAFATPPLTEPEFANGPEVQAAIAAANNPGSVGIAAPRLRIMSFNARKLGMNRPGLERQWLLLMQKMSEVDVVMLTDFSGSSDELEVRAKSLLPLLDAASARLAGRALPASPEEAMFYLCNTSGSDAHVALWNFTVSDVESGSEKGTHAIFVKSPFQILKSKTTTTHVLNDTQVLLQNPPLTATVRDTRSEKDGGFPPGKNTFVLTMVHMPRATGATPELRDVELEALLHDYWSGGDEDQAKTSTMHVIAGDMNVYPTESQFKLSERGWCAPMIPETVSTTAGHGATDNFIVNTNSMDGYTFYPFVRLMALPPTQEGSDQVQISDHFPIELEIYNCEGNASDSEDN